MPPAPAGDMQRRPFEEPGLIEQQAYDDNRDERGCRVPDDAPHHRHVGQRYDAREQRHDSPAHCAPSDAKALGLPNDERDRRDEDQYGKEHQATR